MASLMASNMAGLTALIFSGRARRTSAIPASTSIFTSASVIFPACRFLWSMR